MLPFFSKIYKKRETKKILNNNEDLSPYFDTNLQNKPKKKKLITMKCITLASYCNIDSKIERILFKNVNKEGLLVNFLP